MDDPIGRAREAWAQESLGYDDEADYDGHDARNCYDCNGTGECEDYGAYQYSGAPLIIRCPCPCHMDYLE